MVDGCMMLNLGDHQHRCLHCRHPKAPPPEVDEMAEVVGIGVEMREGNERIWLPDGLKNLCLIQGSCN